jgi:hypothetical protein
MQSVWRSRNFDDLILVKSWRGSLLAICLGLIASFLLLGFWWPYWRIADMDFWMVYEGWLFNDRLPQEWFDHPGYLTILSLGEWYRALHALGLLDVHALSGLPAPQDSEHAWTAAVRAGRVLSLVFSTLFVVTFGALVRRLIGDWRVAALAAFMLAFSGGLAMNARMIRTELLSAGFVTIALLILLIAARGAGGKYRPLLVGLAAFLVTLGHINKVQAIFPICALPFMVLWFGRVSDEADHSPRALHVIVALFAAAVAVPAGSLVLPALGQTLQPLVLHGVSLAGLYQLAIAIWVVAAIVVFAIMWRVPVAETLATMACVLAGVSLALLSLSIRYNPQNVAVVVNPLEQLLFWAQSSSTPGSGIVSDLLHGMRVVLTTRTFVLDPSARPTIFLEWLAIAGIVTAWRSGQRMLALQAAVLIGTGWALDSIYAVRGLKLQYFILTDPLIIIAAALLVANLEILRTHRRAFQIGIAILALHVAISQAEPVKLTLSTSKPFAFCVPHFGYTKRIETYSFCPMPPAPKT